MGSRAVRKALREQEARDSVRNDGQNSEYDSDSEEMPQQKSAFALLDADDNDEEGDKDEDDTEGTGRNESEVSEAIETPQAAVPDTQPSKKKKKRKQKQKQKQEQKQKKDSASDPEMDEIDAALKTLGATRPVVAAPLLNDALMPLKIDTSHLHAENEMRRLFGRAAVQSETQDQPRRRNRPQHDLADAVGRQGRTRLTTSGPRRNIFIQGREEWPRGTSEGLSMQIVEKRADGTVEYTFVHNKPYRDLQAQFLTCVESMDPERMITLLQHHPYHISTLLQVSEIAKQERDHTTSGMLLERALFNFGRCLHVTFAGNLAEGKARLDFRRLENRELWTAAVRYIANLSMRSTWRTVFEWAKMLLALDPADPFCLRLVLDQYALRARQPQQFLDLLDGGMFDWSGPNISLSKALALVQTGQVGKGKQTLYKAVATYPHVVGELCRELKLDPPAGIWGKMPRTDWEKLHADLYTTRAKDLWNTPEATDLLLEVASALSGELPEPAVDDKPIGRDLCRHVLLTDQPALIALLPKSITSQIRNVSDPLPPDDEIEYDGHSSAPPRARLLPYLGMYMSMLQSTIRAGDETRADYSPEELERWVREHGVGTEAQPPSDETVDTTARSLGRIQQIIGPQAIGLLKTRSEGGGSGLGPEHEREGEGEREHDGAEREILELLLQLAPDATTT